MNDFLRKVPLFADLPEQDLNRLCEMVEEIDLPAGEELFAEGSPGDRAFIIEQGRLEVIKTSSGREVLLAVRDEPGTVIGEMALLEEAPRMASVRAGTDSRLLVIQQEQLEQLLNASPSAARAMLHTVLARWRSTEVMLRQSEKMAQLGTLTAGVAHELNNPAAAVKRGAGQLTETMSDFQNALTHVNKLNLSAEQKQTLNELTVQAQTQAAQPSNLDALTRSDREYELETWLEEAGLANAWEIAPTLANMHFQAAELKTLNEYFATDELGAVLTWLSATYQSYGLLAEISQGAGRLSEIVKALKSYAYLDQAPVQAVDVHEGLDDTLLILRSKLRVGINVHRSYTPNLPQIQAYGSELNQVWTNIIDNAVDALNGTGEITLRTRLEDNWIIVEIEDNGPGIPADIQPRIFDPFFTTKPPGKGTGLGLNISYNIIVNKHKGDIRIFSQPGKTCFQVWLPPNPDTADNPPPPVAPIHRADDAEFKQILETVHSIAVVGISTRKDAPRHTVPAYLQKAGYHIYPVNPKYKTVLGQPAFATLSDIPDPVDEVMLFRRSEAVLPFVEEAIQIGAKVIWMQEGIINQQAAEKARQAGLTVVMDTCMRSTHKRLKQKKH